MTKIEEANSVKPEKFSGQNFRRWQRQLKYWLTVLGLISAIKPNNHSNAPSNPPSLVASTSTQQHSSSKAKGNKPYFVCGRTNHWAKDCYYKKTEAYKPKPKKYWKGSKDQVHMLEENEGPSEPIVRYNSSSLSVNFTYENNEWWLDSGANVHVCSDRSFF